MNDNPPPPTPPPEPPKEDPITINKLDVPCRVASVKFEGVHRTRPTLLAKIVSDVFTAKSLMDFLQLSMQARENLKTLNAFKSVDIKVKPVNETDEDSFEVTFVVEERNRIAASAKTTVDEHSSYLDLQLALPNINGVGDTLELHSKLSRHFYSGEFLFTAPLMPWRNLMAPKYSLSLSQYQWDSLPSKIDQEDKSIVNSVDFFSLPQVHHSISFENIWRYIKSSSPKTTPLEIREQCGHSIKSSIKHTVTFDNRIGGNFPIDGVLAKLTNEFTTNLVSGAAKFTRHEANFQINTLLIPQYDVLCQANLFLGTLIRPQKIFICDKFFAGGPIMMRGFGHHGVGSNVKGCPIGDASYLSAGLHLYSILPFTTPDSTINEFIRPHLFVNTGTIGNIHDIGRVAGKEDIRREAIRFKNSLRYSCGLGLVAYFGKLRLEVNYCLPLIFKEGDIRARGIQWGFGLHYT